MQVEMHSEAMCEGMQIDLSNNKSFIVNTVAIAQRIFNSEE